MPLCALFIIFDFVVHNPDHPETRDNLTLLDILSGHFSLLENASKGSMPGGYLSYFNHTARNYVRNRPSQPTSQSDNTETNMSDVPSLTGLNSAGIEQASSATNVRKCPDIMFVKKWLTFVEAENPALAGDVILEPFDPDLASLTAAPWAESLQIGAEADFGGLFSSIISWSDIA